MKPFSIAILVYGDINSTRNALTEEKYRDLASAFIEAGFNVSIDSIESNLKRSRSLLLESVPKNDGQRQAKANNVTMIDRFWPQLAKEKQFAQQYLSMADASARTKLFVKS